MVFKKKKVKIFEIIKTEKTEEKIFDLISKSESSL